VFKLSPDIQKNKKKGLKRRGVGMKRVELVMKNPQRIKFTEDFLQANNQFAIVWSSQF
jgi:hypothetical protein